MRNTTSSYFPSQIGTWTARIPLGSFKDFSWASNFNGNSRFQFADPLTIQLDGGCFISCRTKSDIESRQFWKMWFFWNTKTGKNVHIKNRNIDLGANGQRRIKLPDSWSLQSKTISLCRQLAGSSADQYTYRHAPPSTVRDFVLHLSLFFLSAVYSLLYCLRFFCFCFQEFRQQEVFLRMTPSHSIRLTPITATSSTYKALASLPHHPSRNFDGAI